MKNLQTAMKQLETSFVKLLKLIFVVREEVYSATDLKNMYSKIRSKRN